ncbi:MAG: endonuclease/exonuclease/phosphatase family protein [Proteobacteria bacterium]|nr:endonuclease/exonuclease/phosphatase family protein [Pseudomonadota bacterium]
MGWSAHTHSEAVLKVITLNLAHGRSDGPNQMLQNTQSITDNLVQVADMFIRSDADLVALQEADGISVWSGNFDHVGFLAEAAGYPYHRLAVNAQGRRFAYGTGLLSRYQILETIKHTFERSPPTLTKGFILGHIRTPFGEGRGIDVVSVHLDFLRAGVRAKQIDELVSMISHRSHPTIVLGDLNSDWLAKKSAVRDLVQNHGLHAWQPKSSELGTFDDGENRLDWILISPDLEFADYTVLPDVVSDHRAVVATIRMKNTATRTNPVIAAGAVDVIN